MSILLKHNYILAYNFLPFFVVDYSFHHQLWLENKTIDIVLIKILFIRADNQTATKKPSKIYSAETISTSGQTSAVCATQKPTKPCQDNP